MEEAVETPAEGAEESAWHESIDWGEGFELPEKVAEFKSPADLAKSYESLRSKLVESGKVVPESVEGYTWQVPDDLKELLDPSEDLAKYHEAGLDDKTVTHILDAQASAIRTMTEAMKEAQVEAAKESEAALKEKWGLDYSSRLQAVNKLKERFPDAVEQLVAGGLANSQPVLEMMDEVARSIREARPVGRQADGRSAEDELKAIKESEAYQSGRHPEHRAAMERVLELQKMKLTSQ